MTVAASVAEKQIAKLERRDDLMGMGVGVHFGPLCSMVA